MPYYNKYDQHYRSLYEQGIDLWSDGPDHGQKIKGRVKSMLLELRLVSKGLSLLEMGCGEGILGRTVVDMGMSYLGIDYSPHAIARAKETLPRNEARIEFRVMDALSPDADIILRQFDIVLDVDCLHMFVLDPDRITYLSNVRNLMVEEGVFLLLNQERNEGAYDSEILSVEQYEQVFRHDLSKIKEWEVWNGSNWVSVCYPSFACRPRRKSSYIEELERAGFTVGNVIEKPNGHMLDFVLRPRSMA